MNTFRKIQFCLMGFFSCCFGLSISALGQNSLELEKKTLIKVSPTSLLEPETIVLQGGAEYFFSDKISIQSELGLNLGLFGVNSSRGKNEHFKIWRSKNEIKWYTRKNYWALEIFTVQKDFTRNEDFYFNSQLQDQVYYNKARINFSLYGSGLKFGRQVFVSKNILLDSFVGIGIRFRNRSVRPTELSVNQNPEEFTESFISFGERYQFEGKDEVPHFTIGFKIGILTGSN